MSSEEPDDLRAVYAWLRAREASVVAPAGLAERIRARLQDTPAQARPSEPERRAVLRLVHSLAEQPALAAPLQQVGSRDALLAMLQAIGAERGLAFSTAAAAEVLRTQQAANDEGELDDEQLSAVAGGQGAMLLALWSLFTRLP